MLKRLVEQASQKCFYHGANASTKFIASPNGLFNCGETMTVYESHVIDFKDYFDDEGFEIAYELMMDLQNYLEHAPFKHCENCGGIVPELVFIIGDKEYFFTLYQLAEHKEKGRVFMKTDYKKFANYCREVIK